MIVPAVWDRLDGNCFFWAFKSDISSSPKVCYASTRKHKITIGLVAVPDFIFQPFTGSLINPSRSPVIVPLVRTFATL